MGIKLLASVETEATRKIPPLNRWIRLAASSSCCMPMKLRCTSSKKASPSEVGTTLPGKRSNRRRPVSFSSCAMERLTLGCEVWRIPAAAVVEPDSLTALNAST